MSAKRLVASILRDYWSGCSQEGISQNEKCVKERNEFICNLRCLTALLCLVDSLPACSPSPAPLPHSNKGGNSKAAKITLRHMSQVMMVIFWFWSIWTPHYCNFHPHYLYCSKEFSFPRLFYGLEEAHVVVVVAQPGPEHLSWIPHKWCLCEKLTQFK